MMKTIPSRSLSGRLRKFAITLRMIIVNLKIGQAEPASFSTENRTKK